MPTDPEADAGELSQSIQPGMPPRAPASAQRPSKTPEERVDVERSTLLFGTELTASQGRPIWGTFFAVAGLAVLAGFLAAQVPPHPAGVLAPPLFVVALALLRGWAMPVRFTFRPEGIEVKRPPRLVRYEEILHALWIQRGRRAVVELLLADGHVRLPAPPDKGDEILEFLESQPRGPRDLGDVPARFTDFLKQQKLLSPDEIYIFRGGKRQVTPRTRRYRRAAWWFVLLAGTWFALAAIDRTPLFASFGALAGLFAVIFLAGGYTPLRHSHLGIKKIDDAILIITPNAMALQQGDLCGELRWPELVSVAPYGMGSSRSLDLAGLNLKVRGANILLVDIFQWPLTCAAELIKDYSGK